MLPRCCCASAALEAQLDGLQGATTTLPLQQRISSYALSTIRTMRLRSCYNLSAGAALILCLCCTLELLLYKSAGNPGSAAVDHQPSNKMDNRIVPVAMMQLAIMNQRLARSDEENQPRRRRAKRFWVRPRLSADKRLQFGHSGGGGSGSAWGAGAWRAGAWDAPSYGSGWVTVVSCACPGLDFAFHFWWVGILKRENLELWSFLGASK